MLDRTSNIIRKKKLYRKPSPALSLCTELLFIVLLLIPQILTAQETNHRVIIQAEFRHGIEIFSPQTAASLDVKIVSSSGSPHNNTRPAVLNVALQRSSKQESESKKNNPENNPEKSNNFPGIPVNFSGITASRKSANPTPPLFEEDISVVISEKTPPVPVTFLLPESEGVYDIILTLQYKTENLTLSNSFKQLQSPRKRSETCIITQTVCQCVVLDSKKNTGNLKNIQDLSAADLTETYIKDTKELPSSKRWSLVPPFPKVGNLSGILTTEIPPLRRSNALPNNKQTAVDAAGNLPSCVSLFLEQYTEKPESLYFGSGHCKWGTFVSAADTNNKSPSATIEFSRIAAAGQDGAEAWEAFPLQVKETGVPHLLEIEYPAENSSSLGVSVLDLLNDTNGKPIPNVLLNCNFCISDEVIPRSETSVLSHKVIFYPKTKQPVILLSNRNNNKDALFGQIRISRIDESAAPQAELPPEMQSELQYELPRRLIAAYFHRSDFWKHFSENTAANNSATSAVSSDFSNETLCPADWNVFYNGTQQLIDVLKRNGYNGIMFNACSKDTVLYPSVVLHYNSKKRFTNSADHSSAKNALELTAKMFEREKMRFIPAVDFNMLLPVIENKIYYEPELSKQLLAHGSISAGTKSGKNGERYNLLNPLVQEAMLNVLSELASRCAEYKSFSGIAVVLSPDGYAQLSSPIDGLDAQSLRRFQEDTGINLPKEIVQAADAPAIVQFYFQSSAETFSAWRQWRCKQVAEFYRKAAEVLTAIRPDTRLYFATGTLLDRQDISQYCLPSLFAGNPLPQIFQLLGFDLAQNVLPPGTSMLLPERITSALTSESAAVYQFFNTSEFSQFREQSGQQNNSGTPVLFFHETESGWDTVPSAEQARKRFVKQLAQSDVSVFFDGGDTFVPVSEASAAEFAESFQQLPMIPFQTFRRTSGKPDAQTEENIQPLTVRYADTAGGYYVYLLNKAPFPVNAQLILQSAAPSGAGLVFKELSGKRSLSATEKSGGKYLWNVALSPYDFIAVRFDGTDVSIDNVTAECPEQICGSNGTLRRTINNLGECIKKAQQGTLWNKLENPDCEPVNNNSNAVSGWELSAKDNSTVQLDTVNKHSGLSSIRFAKVNGTEPIALFSNVFQPPQTGRLFVSLNLGLQSSALVPLNVILTGKISGRQFVRTVPVDTVSLFSKPETAAGSVQAGSGQAGGVPNAVQWRSLTVPFDCLPMNSIEELRIGFVCAHPALIWIDNIRLYDLSFTKDELNILYLLVSAADRRCSARRYSELMDILDGYWGQYLFRYFSDNSLSETSPAKNNRNTSRDPMLIASSAEIIKISERKPEPEEHPNNVLPEHSSEQNSAKKPVSDGYFERIRKWFWRQ